MNSSRPLDARRLDVSALSAAAGELAGEWPQAGFARLATAALPTPAPPPVRWRVVGKRAVLEGAGMQPALQLEANTEVTLECQRCLQPLLLPLRIDRRLFFVEGEDAAAALDAESDDDVLAMTPALDLHALVEDELLLALPVVPRHDDCTMPLAAQAASGDAERLPDEASENPFAALAALKRGPRPN